MISNDIIGLLYSARNHFQSIHMEWEYVYNEEILQKLFDSQNDRSVAILRSLDGNVDLSKSTLTNKLLLNNWDSMRLERKHDSRHTSIHAIVGDKEITLASTTSPQITRQIPKDDPTTFEDRLLQAIYILDPSFLLSNHDLSFVDQDVFLDRDVIQLQAFPRLSQRDRGREAYFWHSTKEIDLIVDKATGILLEYKLSFEGVEFARSTVSKLILDLEISEDDILEGLT